MLTGLLTLAVAVPTGDSSFLFWGLVLAAAALVLFVVELFVPTGGLLGLLCGVCVIASLVAFYKHDTSWGIAATAGYCILAPMALVFGLRLWSHSPIARRLILGGSDDSDERPEEAMAVSEHARRARLEALRGLVGAEGHTVTPLRPVGFVMIGGRRIDAMAESSVIDTATPIVVIDVIDNQVKVRPR